MASEGRSMQAGIQKECHLFSVSMLQKAAQMFCTSSPAVSKHLVREIASRKFSAAAEKEKPAYLPNTCIYCGTIFLPDNHTVRFLPRMKKSKKIGKLMKRQENGDHLNKYHQRMVKLFLQSKTRKVIMCKTCCKKTVTACCGRPDEAPPEQQLKTTPSVPDDGKLSKSQRRKQKRKRAQAKKEAFLSLHTDDLMTPPHPSSREVTLANSTPHSQDYKPSKPTPAEEKSTKYDKKLISNEGASPGTHLYASPLTASSSWTLPSSLAGRHDSSPDLAHRGTVESDSKRGKKRSAAKEKFSPLHKMLKQSEKEKTQGSSLHSFLFSI